jgi:DNA-binding transcriptional LysR family regulator
MASLEDLSAFLAVARAGGFRDAARNGGGSASGLSEAVRRVEASLGVRLLHRTTRSVLPTEAGAQLISRLAPALGEIAAALDTVNGFRDSPTGTLRLNVPISASRMFLPEIVPAFLAAYPDIRLEITAEDGFVDIVEGGYDAGIRYGERLEQDMIAVPIGPREQRFAAAAAPGYLAQHGNPDHPRDLLDHACLGGRQTGGRVGPWEFERAGDIVLVEPSGPLTVVHAGTDLAVAAAVAGTGIIFLFEGWLQPHFTSGALVPVLEDWWQAFPGPFLYYSGRRNPPAPLRAFIDFTRTRGAP